MLFDEKDKKAGQTLVSTQVYFGTGDKKDHIYWTYGSSIKYKDLIGQGHYGLRTAFIHIAAHIIFILIDHIECLLHLFFPCVICHVCQLYLSFALAHGDKHLSD